MSSSFDERYQLECCIWDLYKEIHGVRPRHLRFDAMSVAELNDYANRLCLQLHRITATAREARRLAKADARREREIQARREFGAPLESALAAALKRVAG